jgi:hypothetical protein
MPVGADWLIRSITRRAAGAANARIGAVHLDGTETLGDWGISHLKSCPAFQELGECEPFLGTQRRRLGAWQRRGMKQADNFKSKTDDSQRS